ncbi:OmpA family protein [Nannocystis radixulma]|uniref:OmpA family protein n=1 Tax=Nannocystis radixulma TaxID=2995305 RepID=A0ABT5BKV2_9BACT|nr:OmpA family protein [Nannocystis radixulma]MDC0673657.1 OmpA family protein [Nannocystis radixulma]
MRSHVRPLVVLAIAGVAGCSVKTSFNVSASPADVQARTAVETRASAVKIVRHGDKLDYENGEIEFATNSAALIGKGTDDILDRYAEVLEQYPALKIRIDGHTDSRGSTKSNQELSEKRAQSIKNSIVRRGIAGNRLEARGYGESQPERVEPNYCRNRSEETVAEAKLAECKEIWTANRRAGFIVTEGADSLPAEGAAVADQTPAEPAPKASPEKRRPDWALRLFGGYSMLYRGFDYHGGHFGVGVHASQRFGARGRGYIGGGPRLHYRSVRAYEGGLGGHDIGVHMLGPEGNLLIGGGSDRVVGLFSLRLGLGAAFTRGQFTDDIGTVAHLRGTLLAGWLLGGVTVLGKINERWSLGGHAEAGIIGVGRGLGLATEIGLNAAWHFGRGRRKGI